ncbi:MAG: hypothetical protein WCF77_03930 [Minisyncoccia bacterium]
MKSPLEWIREGKPGYAEKKKKAELETRLAALKDALAEITVDAGSAAAHLDAPDQARVPEDARRRDDLATRVEATKKEIAELDEKIAELQK